MRIWTLCLTGNPLGCRERERGGSPSPSACCSKLSDVGAGALSLPQYYRDYPWFSAPKSAAECSQPHSNMLRSFGILLLLLLLLLPLTLLTLWRRPLGALFLDARMQSGRIFFPPSRTSLSLPPSLLQPLQTDRLSQPLAPARTLSCLTWCEKWLKTDFIGVFIQGPK